MRLFDNICFINFSFCNFVLVDSVSVLYCVKLVWFICKLCAIYKNSNDNKKNNPLVYIITMYACEILNGIHILNELNSVYTY